MQLPGHKLGLLWNTCPIPEFSVLVAISLSPYWLNHALKLYEFHSETFMWLITKPHRIKSYNMKARKDLRGHTVQ